MKPTSHQCVTWHTIITCHITIQVTTAGYSVLKYRRIVTYRSFLLSASTYDFRSISIPFIVFTSFVTSSSSFVVSYFLPSLLPRSSSSSSILPTILSYSSIHSSFPCLSLLFLFIYICSLLRRFLSN
jgi:hypothetical protein